MSTDRQLSILIDMARRRDFTLALAAEGPDEIRVDLDRYMRSPEVHVRLHDPSLAVILRTALVIVCLFPETEPIEAFTGGEEAGT